MKLHCCKEENYVGRQSSSSVWMRTIDQESLWSQMALTLSEGQQLTGLVNREWQNVYSFYAVISSKNNVFTTKSVPSNVHSSLFYLSRSLTITSSSSFRIREFCSFGPSAVPWLTTYITLSRLFPLTSFRLVKACRLLNINRVLWKSITAAYWHHVSMQPINEPIIFQRHPRGKMTTDAKQLSTELFLCSSVPSLPNSFTTFSLHTSIPIIHQ